MLTGGSTPQRAYELAAERDADWSAATVWLGDERCVPPDHERSNFAMAERRCSRAVRRRPTVMRMQGELGPTTAAAAYEARLRERMGTDPRWTSLLLGLGPDAHTASLFPGKPALEERRRLVVGVPQAGDGAAGAAGHADAAGAQRRARGRLPGHGRRQGATPCARVRRPPDDRVAGRARAPGGGTLTVFLDEAARRRA